MQTGKISVKKQRLAASIPRLLSCLESCRLCPRHCGVDRTRNETGRCATLDQAIVYGFMPHFGEEPPLSGRNGSGTIFFSKCSLNCCFCQNHDISIQGEGDPATPDQIARAMLQLQNQGCHNINLVTPTHVLPFILQALDLALDQGLSLPLVYNTSGYENPGIIELLDGIVDIYLPDFKFWNPDLAEAACQAPDYPKRAKAALKVMHSQVGDLKTDGEGIALSGLLVRHLVLPETLSQIPSLCRFLSESISPDTSLNLMSQYRPLWKADQVPSLSRGITAKEFTTAKKIARDMGLNLVD